MGFEKRKMLRGVAVACISLALPGTSLGQQNPRLKYMFRLPPPHVTASQPFSCPAPVAPLVDMSNMHTFYAADATQSVIDKKKMDDYVQRTKAPDRQKKILTGLVKAAITSSGDRPEIASCILTQLDAWADAGALLQNLDENNPTYHRQAVLVMIWTVIGFANAYEAASEIAPVPPASKEKIEGWFRQLSNVIIAEFTPPATARPKKEQWLDGNSNHRYWAAAAVGVIAVHLDDKKLFDWSMSVLHSALAEANADGSLTRELQRGGKSLHYQNYAMKPLAILVRLADANGVRFSREEEEKLSAVARFSAQSFEHPEQLEARLGIRQEKKPDMIEWIDALDDHFHRSDPQLASDLERIADPVRASFDKGCTVTCTTMLENGQTN
ncbi:alginate lyase family protein [Rhizobium sp. RAF56]|uniref:alginate lyase family protein n=1 Tax=Rhizobium sp. RAF56 TaxID=3233062 RepID=UPI003F9C0D47